MTGMPEPDAPVFLDTNVLVYAVGEAGPKRDRAERLTARRGTVVSDQIIAEFVSACLSKRILPPAETRRAARLYLGQLSIVPNSAAVLTRALVLNERYGFQWWDALVVAAAVESGCATLYSEDMQDGQVVDGTWIVNPFRVSPATAGP